MRKPSPSMIVALLALFVALGGTAVATTGGNFILGQQNTADATSDLQGSVNGPQLRVTNSNASGTAIRGRRSAATGGTPAIQGDTASTSAGAAGVYGLVSSTSSAGDSNGVRGQNSGAGRGVLGQSVNGPGVFGTSTNHYGVWGIGSYGLVGSGPQGGVWTSTDGAAASGVYAQTTAAGTGSGVHGIHTSTSGTGPGIRGETNSNAADATGILARANATNAGRDNVALRAINNNTNQYGMGVWGSIAGSGWGVLGEAGANGIGVIGKLAGTGVGVYGQTGSGGVGVKAIGGKTGVFGQATDAGGYAFAAQGDAGQNRSSGGWVKAMAFVNPAYPAGQQVRQCFNSQLAPQANCGINAVGVAVGHWEVDFGFDISDRFISVTPTPNFRTNNGMAVASACTYPCAASTSKADVYIVYSASGEDTNAGFYIVVF